jgi:hypothetical protein
MSKGEVDGELVMSGVVLGEGGARDRLFALFGSPR